MVDQVCGWSTWGGTAGWAGANSCVLAAERMVLPPIRKHEVMFWCRLPTSVCTGWAGRGASAGAAQARRPCWGQAGVQAWGAFPQMWGFAAAMPALG
jgi:hypothetical protein